MSQIIDEVRLIFSDATENKNKFWHGKLFDNGDVLVEWGRVGYNSQSKLHPNAGERKLESLKKSKLKKGYTEQRTIASNLKNVAKNSLKQVAVNDIGGCTEVKKLISWLADINIHKITSNTNIVYDSSEGTFNTPLGLVTIDGIHEAQSILNKISNLVESHSLDDNFSNLVSEYLRIIPQNVGMKRGWENRFFGSHDLIAKQFDIIDSLEASLQKISTKTQENSERVFEVKLSIVTDRDVIKNISDKYEKSRGFHRDVKNFKIKQIFQVYIPTMQEAFEKDGKNIGNIMSLFHGTKASNLLSILKVGLIIPPSNASHCTGRMFGPGIYFSDQSSKSLRYATNAWTYGGNTDRTFMFICDVAMGRYYVPSGPRNSLPPKGYDSYFAKAGISGVMNNEMIIPRVSQCNLVHLIEFSH